MEIVSATLPEVREDIIPIYRAAFALPPHCEDERDVERFRGELEDCASKEDFRLLVAIDRGEVVGFTYGYTSGEGGWTRSVVAPLMEESEADYWFADNFLLADLAVVPEAHERGVGGRLHDEILSAVPNRTAMLFVNQDAAPALGLYVGRGWEVIVEEFMGFTSGKSFKVMGFRL